MKIVFIIFCFSVCTGFEVLIATPAVVKSLHGLFSSIAIGLADAGHNVTFVSSYPLPKEHKNVTTIVNRDMKEIIDAISLFDMQTTSDFKEILENFAKVSVQTFWSNPQSMAIWNRKNDFDLVVAMSYFSEMVFPFLMDYRGSFVQVCTPGVEPFSIAREGNWLPPSVVPAIVLNYDENMSLWERIINLPATIGYHFIEETSRKAVAKELHDYFPDIKELTSYYDQIDLTLINGHFALDGPVPLLPSQIEIGTINAKPAKPLPKNLEEFAAGSGEPGIIYFSLGSMAKSTEIPNNVKQMFVEAFRKVPQRVIWKYEGDDLELPPNVLTQAWMPQQDILGHPKTRVFISHCGNLGTQEAKYHGVPVLAVPIAFDQPRNAIRMERKGFAIVLNWEEITTDKIMQALNTLINDTSYKERLQVVSSVLKDQRETPVERAVWWMEYVVRHNGAPHLRYAGRRLALYQYIMLDVILFWILVLIFIILVIFYSVKTFCCRKKGRGSITNEKLKKQ